MTKYDPFGHSIVEKLAPSMGTQQPMAQPPAPGTSNATQESTLYSGQSNSGGQNSPQEPAAYLKYQHSHLGYQGKHPVALRHRKISQDPLHGQEDKLFDEMKDLTDKAGGGMCSPQEMIRLSEVQGQLSAINNQRMDQARGVLGNEFNAAGPSNQNQAQPVQPPTPLADQNTGQQGFRPQPQPRQPSPGQFAHHMPQQGQKLNNDANEMGAPGAVPNGGGFDPTRRAPRTPRPINIG